MAVLVAPLVAAMLPVTVASAAATIGSWAKVSVSSVGQPPHAAQTAIGCASATTCFSFGYSNVSPTGHSAVFVTKRTAAGWQPTTRLRLPTNADAAGFAIVSAVRCPSVTVCVAVGQYATNAQNYEPMAATFNGTSWSRGVSFGLPPDAGSNPQTQANEVACPRVSMCLAVGTYFTSDGYARAFLATWQYGQGWGNTIELTPPPDSSATPSTTASGLACSTTTDCWIVGGYLKSNRASGAQPYYVDWFNGSVTQGIASPVPSDQSSSSGTTLASIGCAGLSCIATGAYTSSADKNLGWAVDISSGGAAASTIALPTPSDARTDPYVEYLSVGCSATKCLVSGTYTTTSSSVHGFVTPVWKGAPGNPVEFVFPTFVYGKRTSGSSLGSLACPSSTTCYLTASLYAGDWQNPSVSGGAILAIKR